MSRILYSGTRNASSWAFRAWLALKEGGIEFEEEIVDIRLPQRLGNLARIGQFSPPGAVPVLVDEGEVIFDSLAIMEYANELVDGRLLPIERKRRARARSLMAWQHSGLSGVCPRLSFESAFYPRSRPATGDELFQAARLFTALENQLSQSGGPCLAGDLSLADLCFVPTIIRLVSHMSLEQWPLTACWASRMTARPAVREWLSEAQQLPPVLHDEYWQPG